MPPLTVRDDVAPAAWPMIISEVSTGRLFARVMVKLVPVAV
jgi:hypothetical protein